MFVNVHPCPDFNYSLFKIAGLVLLCSCGNNRYEVWDTYRGSPDALQYSSLSQIDTSNVHLLTPAWTFHTGDSGQRTTIECNPIIVGNTVYLTSPTLHLIALDATHGKELWRYKPTGKEVASGINRGVTYWKDKGLEYIFFPAGKYMYAVNARTGSLIESFGDQGKIDLRAGLGQDTAKLSVTVTTPGILFKNILIIGSATGEGYNASPGHIRAYEAATGNLLWIFHTIPQKGEYGYETWAWIEGENYGGTNDWGGMSLDEKKGIVYVSTGSPTYDFYGANRVGANLFGNCIIALDAATGIRKWHYQAVHHDIWDYDLPCAPTLADIHWQGKDREVLLQPTKMGELLVLDRNTGEALLPSVEKPVPPSDIPGEQAFATQPYNQGILLTGQGWDTTDLTTLSDSARNYLKQQTRQYRAQGMYDPPSLNGTIGRPGTRGGMLWGGISFDPQSQTAFANCNDFPMIYQLEKVPSEAGDDLQHEGASRGQIVYALNCSNCHGADRKGATEAVPSLMGLSKRYSKEGLSKIITQGKGLMPAHTQFSSPDLNAMVTYLMNEPDSSATGKTERVQMNHKLPLEKYVLKSYKIFTDQEGFPASAPPWGTLNAVDMKTGQLKWQVPLGYYPKLKDRGFPNTGTQNFGGCVSTAGGLVFIGATADEMFRAFNVRNGAELWSYKLSAGGYATPSVYQVKGKQYVIIAAGGGNRNGTASADVYMAFALEGSR
ncbi:MAG: PQQ-binding-like beta-propeller repeat protein [Saprospiraceae bacterium]|nr:PQQ-binding-like beta-propeller repeat protein [Saprospiraceae bacterium]